MEDSEQKKLFVGGISWEISEDELKEYFSKYGTVASCVIAKDRTTGKPRGFAFVSYSETESFDQALLQHTHLVHGRTVDVRRAIPRSEQLQSQQQQSRGLNRNGRGNGRGDEYFKTKKIFVGGLSANLTEEDFKGYFESFGRITDVVVMHDNVTHRPRGFGFITFESEDSVEEVMQKNFHELSGKLVEVKRAIPKDGNGNTRPGGGGGGGGSGSGSGSGGRGSNYNSYHGYHQGNYPYYTPNESRYGLLPSYGPLSGYGGYQSYHYGAGIYGGGYLSGGFTGIGYGMAPMAPRSPWNNPAMVGFRGSPLTYGNAPPMYPSYMNTGAANGYNGSDGDAQGGVGAGARSMPSRSVRENVEVQSS